ncbi:universal stress protein [Alteraurantiacibacter aestuarii]|uniref:universal stress protein n=1 Tax=Alteraurantiacibacter aestuarii TaxID=650004 RepID=UPI0031E2BA07
MRSILLHIHDDPCLDARIQVAFDLARTFDGHVTCLQVLPYEFGVPGDIYGNMALQLNPILRENAENLATTVKTRLAREDVPWDWVLDDGLAQLRLKVHAGLSDVVVMGACAEPFGQTSYSDVAAEVVTGARTPVMLVPEKCTTFDPSVPAVVAWNGSPEASRALRAAVPVLQRSSAVHLLSVIEEKRSEFDLPAIEGARYLARHGIEATMVELPQSSGGIRDTLMHAAHSREAGLIVMGAYGHSRLRERILGGVSRSMITDPELPILLCH